MVMSPTKIDAILRGLKLFGPYGMFLAFGGLGLSMFAFGGMATTTSGKLDPAGKVMRWIGVGFSLLSMVGFALWHFFGWPIRLAEALVAQPEPPPKSKAKATRH